MSRISPAQVINELAAARVAAAAQAKINAVKAQEDVANALREERADALAPFIELAHELFDEQLISIACAESPTHAGANFVLRMLVRGENDTSNHQVCVSVCPRTGVIRFSAHRRQVEGLTVAQATLEIVSHLADLKAEGAVFGTPMDAGPVHFQFTNTPHRDLLCVRQKEAE